MHENPERAGFVKHPIDWKYGSAFGSRIYAGLELVFLLPVNPCQIYNLKFIVTTIAGQSPFSPELLLKHALQLIVSMSARLAQMQVLPEVCLSLALSFCFFVVKIHVNQGVRIQNKK